MLADKRGSINDPNNSNEKNKVLAQHLSPSKNICNKLARYFARVSFTRYFARASFIRDFFLANFITVGTLIASIMREREQDGVSERRKEVEYSGGEEQGRNEAVKADESKVREQLYAAEGEVEGYDNERQPEKKKRFYQEVVLLDLLEDYLKDNKDVYLETKQWQAVGNLKTFHNDRAREIGRGKTCKHKVVIPFIFEDKSVVDRRVVVQVVVCIIYYGKEKYPGRIYYFDPLKRRIDKDVLETLKLSDILRDMEVEDIVKDISDPTRTEQTNCGMWLVEVTRSLCKPGEFNFPEVDVENATQEHIQIIDKLKKQRSLIQKIFLFLRGYLSRSRGRKDLSPLLEAEGVEEEPSQKKGKEKVYKAEGDNEIVGQQFLFTRKAVENQLTEVDLSNLTKVIEQTPLRFNHLHHLDSHSVVESARGLPRTEQYIWLNGRTIPLGDDKLSSVVKNSDEFFRGIKDFTEFLWPATFYSLLTHDIGCYFLYPENRYGNTLKNILLGIPSNQQTLTTYLPTFPWWPVVALTPIFFGSRQVFNNYLSRHLTRDEAIEKLNSHHSSFLIDTASWFFNPFSKTKYSLRQAKRELLWDISKCKVEENSYLKAVSRFSKHSSGLAQLEALATLARIADIDVGSYQRLGLQERYEQLKDVRDEALEKLKSKADFQKNIVRYYYANYLLWSLGHSERRALEPLFWLSLLGLFYSKLRFGEMFIQSVYQTSKWLVDRHHCHQQNKVWSYTSEFDKYECSVCGNWTNKDHVYYGNIFAAQSCLDDILSTPRSAQEVLRILYRVQYFGFSKLDLSKQEWHDWSQQEWDNVLNVTLRSSRGKLTTFDLSRRVFNPVPLDPVKARLLAQVINEAITVEQLDLGNRGIGANATVALVSLLANKNIKYFDLSGNNIGIEGSVAVGRYLSNLPGLQTFKLSNNGLTDDDIIQFASIFKNATLGTLSLSGNEFGQRGIDRLAICFSNQLESLDLSNNDFTDLNLQSLGKYIATNPLKVLRLASSNIGDIEFSSLVIFLPDSNLHSFDISDNKLTQASARSFAQVVNLTNLESVNIAGNSFSDEGIAFISQGLANSTISTFDIGDNEIGDSGIWFFSRFLPQTQIEVLKLSKNRITELGMTDLALALPNSTVKDLDISVNNLEDTGMSELSRALVSPSSHVQKVNLGSNKITARGMSILAVALRNNTIITHVSLGNNPIGDIGIITITDTFTGNNISYIDFTNCDVTNFGLRKLVETLPATNLQTIQLDNNQFSGNSALGVAKVLITPVPHNSTLGDKYISRDQKWAICNAQPRTSTIQLSLIGSNISTDGARAICRVLPSSGITITHFNITDNPIDPNQVDVSNCWISPASSIRAPRIFMLVDTAIKNVFSVKTLNPFFNSPPLNLTIYDQGFIPYHKFGRRESVIRSFAEIFNDQFSSSFFSGSLIEYCLAAAFAFRQEFSTHIKNYLPEYLQKSLLQFISSNEGIVLKDTSELMLRTKHSGVKTLVHDIISILKEAHKRPEATDNLARKEQALLKTKKLVEQADNNSVNIQAKRDKTTWQSTIERASYGLLSLGCVYGTAWAVGAITGNPLLGYLLMPVVMNSRNIVSTMTESYRNHGFFAAFEAGIDTAATSVPGGRLIGRALVEQQESLYRSEFNYCNTGGI